MDAPADHPGSRARLRRHLQLHRATQVPVHRHELSLSNHSTAGRTTRQDVFRDISYFPLVYWMLGAITSVDDLLSAGINKASHLVVVNKETTDSECEDTLADAETIVALQTIFKLFPNANIITELNQASNMRFMHFRAHDEHSQKISNLERKLKSSMTSNLSHIFRLPFAAGQVFIASMLDTLLYQTFVKGYLITFNNNKMKSSKKNSLPRKVLSQLSIQKNPEQEDISDLIPNRMKSLDLSVHDYCDMESKKNDLSYVFLNPSPKRKLRNGDLVYVIQPSSMVAVPSRLNRWKPFQKPKGWTPTLKRTLSENELSDTDSSNQLPDLRDRTNTLPIRDCNKMHNRFHV